MLPVMLPMQSFGDSVRRFLRLVCAAVCCIGIAVSMPACGGSDIEIPSPPLKPDGGGNQGGEDGGGTDPDNPDNPEPDKPELVRLTMVDPAATAETKALYSNLWAVAARGFMFGHHDDLWYGRYWYDEPGGSDTKAVCGDYPAVFSVDLASVMDNRASYDYDKRENAIRRRVMLEAYARGEVIIACCHLNNPVTGGDSWDNSNDNVAALILTEGSAQHTAYLGWLDRLADFALDLKAADGTLVPFVFRPYHEHTQTWSWWGSKCTTEEQFIALWRMTVRHLRDTRGVHNLIYAISPQMDGEYADAKGRLLFRWPGDEWVDFIGMDCYHGLNTAAFSSNLKAISALSLEKRKPCGVTETGQESFTNEDYWTRCLLTPLTGQRVSMVVMWRNKYVGPNESDKHFYSVYPGHPSEENFRIMYSRSRSLFSADLPPMYRMAEGVTVE